MESLIKNDTRISKILTVPPRKGWYGVLGPILSEAMIRIAVISVFSCKKLVDILNGNQTVVQDRQFVSFIRME